MTRRIPRIPRQLLVLALLAGPVIGFGAYRLAAAVERDRAQVHLDRDVAAAALAIERELAADLEVLYALRQLFEAGGPVPRERFTAMAEPILARHTCLQALEWIPRIAHRSRHAHEQSGREGGLDGYTITERTVANSISLALKRTLVASATDTDTVTPSATVKPMPRECIFAGSSSGMILKTPDTLPGANALAVLMGSWARCSMGVSGGRNPALWQ